MQVTDFEIENETVLKKYRGKEKEVFIPEGITEIDFWAFHYSGVQKVHIPESVTIIGEGAFDGSCIEEVTIPSGVRYINDGTFQGCQRLTKVVLPEGLVSIGKHAFYECYKLEPMNFPASLKYIYMDKNENYDQGGIGAMREKIRERIEATSFPETQTGTEVRVFDTDFCFRCDKETNLDKNDYTFTYCGKEMDTEPLRFKPDFSLSPDIITFRDVKDRKVLKLGGSIPTFDSSDSAYDSYDAIYVIEENGRLTGIKVRSGYRLGKVQLLENVRPANKHTKYIMELLGMNVDMNACGEYKLPEF